MRFQRILVPVDFSPQSIEAAVIAVQLANREGGTVRVLHLDSFPGAGAVVVEPVYIPPGLFGGLQADHDRRVQEGLDDITAELGTRRMASVTVETERRMGYVVPGILEEARDWGCDLVVMGSSGLSGTARMILGSVADKVSRQAPCPVLVTRARDPEEHPDRPFLRVQAGIDYEEISGAVARAAAAMVAPGGSLELVHVWTAPHLSPFNVSLGGEERDEVTTFIERARALEAERLDQLRADLGIDQARCYVATGVRSVPATLLDRAEEAHADLLVVGAHGRRDLGERILGTVADRVLRHAGISVLLVPPEASSID